MPERTSAEDHGGLLGAAVVIVIVIAVIGAALGDKSGSSVSLAAAPTTSSANVRPWSANTANPAVANPPADPQAAALAELMSLRQTDQQFAHPDGRFVVQLSSKYPGITAPTEISPSGDHIFTAAEILSEHQALRQRFGDIVFLMLSTDYGKQQKIHGHPLWITFADPGISSFDDGEAWCASNFPGLSGDQLNDKCLPHPLDPAP